MTTFHTQGKIGSIEIENILSFRFGASFGQTTTLYDGKELVHGSKSFSSYFDVHLIEMEFESTAVPQLFSMITKFQQFDGHIIIKRADEDAKMLEVKFEKCKLESFHQRYDYTDPAYKLVTKISLSAGKLVVGEAAFECEWLIPII